MPSLMTHMVTVVHLAYPGGLAGGMMGGIVELPLMYCLGVTGAA
jgi:hypothetical protein